jgi:hypothetical protein
MLEEDVTGATPLHRGDAYAANSRVGTRVEPAQAPTSLGAGGVPQ